MNDSLTFRSKNDFDCDFDSNINNNGTNCSKSGEPYGGYNYETNNSKNASNIQCPLIYRFKFTQEFMDILFQFSKVHQYDDRNSFKEAWSIWMEENENIVTSEIRRLTNLDYKGDICDKMFKSARYYYRKKGTKKNAPSDRRQYISSQKALIDAMDEHIKSNLCKPSEGFEEFCKSHLELLKDEVNHMVKNGLRDHTEIKGKIKKTYKNRYFLFKK